MEVKDVKRLIREWDQFSVSKMLMGDFKSDRSRSLLKTNLYSDLILEVVDSNTKRVVKYNVHKCIIVIASPVWETYLRWTEGNVLKLTSFPSDVIHWLINYAYTDSMELETIEFCAEILLAADFYCIPKLAQQCTDYMIREFCHTVIDVDDFVTVFNIVSLLEIQPLIEICIGYVEDNAHMIFFSEEFLNLTFKALKYILSVKNYLLPEFYFVVGMLRWSLGQTTADNLRNFIIENNILKQFRFKLFSTSDIIHLFDTFTCLFTDNEKYTIIRAIIADEPFPFNYISSNKSLRGDENIINNDSIIIFSPPVVVYEEFTHIGASMVMPLLSLEIEPRYNTFFEVFRKRYEESVAVKIGTYEIKFDGVLDSRTGTVLTVPSQIILELHNMTSFKVEITLNKPGIYRKNQSAYNEFGLLRSGNGIIRGLYNHEKKLNNILAIF